CERASRFNLAYRTESCRLFVACRVAAGITPGGEDYGHSSLLVENDAGQIARDGGLVVRMCDYQEDVGLEAFIGREHRRRLLSCRCLCCEDQCEYEQCDCSTLTERQQLFLAPRLARQSGMFAGSCGIVALSWRAIVNQNRALNSHAACCS